LCPGEGCVRTPEWWEDHVHDDRLLLLLRLKLEILLFPVGERKEKEPGQLQTGDVSSQHDVIIDDDHAFCCLNPRSDNHRSPRDGNA